MSFPLLLEGPINYGFERREYQVCVKKIEYDEGKLKTIFAEGFFAQYPLGYLRTY
jgi:hypothetical protein